MSPIGSLLASDQKGSIAKPWALAGMQTGGGHSGVREVAPGEEGWRGMLRAHVEIQLSGLQLEDRATQRV